MITKKYIEDKGWTVLEEADNKYTFIKEYKEEVLNTSALIKVDFDTHDFELKISEINMEGSPIIYHTAFEGELIYKLELDALLSFFKL